MHTHQGACSFNYCVSVCHTATTVTQLSLAIIISILGISFLVISKENGEFHLLMPQNIVLPKETTYGDKLCHDVSFIEYDYIQGDGIIIYVIPEMTDGNNVTTVKIIDDEADDGNLA